MFSFILQMGKWGIKNLLKVMKVRNGGASMWTQAMWLQSPDFWSFRLKLYTWWGSSLAAADKDRRHPAPSMERVPWHCSHWCCSSCFWNIYLISLHIERYTILSLLALLFFPSRWLSAFFWSVILGKKGWQESWWEFQKKTKFPSHTQGCFLGTSSPQIPGCLSEWELMFRKGYLNKMDTHLLYTL